MVDINQYVEDKSMALYASHVLQLHLWKPVIEGQKREEYALDVLMKIKQILKRTCLPEDFKTVLLNIIEDLVSCLQDARSSVSLYDSLGKMAKKAIFKNTDNISGAAMDRDTYTFIFSILLHPPQT